MKSFLTASITIALITVLGTTAASETVAPPVRPSVLGKGYLTRDALPDATLFIGPPPAAGSAAQARDDELSVAARRLEQSPRWRQAMIDADLMAPNVTAVMSCAAGREIGPVATPKSYRLLRTAAADLGYSTSAVKRLYQRSRPFMVNGAAQCTPDWEPVLRKDGSYPSGHSAIGYGWGLILAELMPDRAAQLIARGTAFGDSRRYCNVHWASDVEAGRLAAAAVVARLHAVDVFRKDLKAARAELARARPVIPSTDCATEASALGTVK